MLGSWAKVTRVTCAFPSEAMRMWPITTRVNKPENDEPSILEPVELAPKIERNYGALTEAAH
jgi:hypothetical protein